MVTIEFTFIECCVVELNLQRPFEPSARVFELVKTICLWKRIKGTSTSFVEQIYLKMTYGTVIDARNPFKGIHTSRLRRAAIVRLFGIPELLLRDERMQTLTFTSDTFHFRGGPFVAIFHSIKPPPPLSLCRWIRWTVYHTRPDIFVSPYCFPLGRVFTAIQSLPWAPIWPSTQYYDPLTLVCVSLLKKLLQHQLQFQCKS